MLFAYIIFTMLLVIATWLITYFLIEMDNKWVATISIVVGICSLPIWVGVEIGNDMGNARHFNAQKQAIEMTMQSDYITDEMKIAYAQNIAEFNQALLTYQTEVKCWWNLPWLNQQCLNIEPIK